LLRVALLVVALGLGAAACGDDDAADSEPLDETELTITLDPDGPGGEAEPQEAKLVCPGANAPRDACEEVGALPASAAAPVPPQTACTEIFGGPDVVRITGTLNGDEVDTELTRANGCEIERFERFVPLLEALFPDYEPGAALNG